MKERLDKRNKEFAKKIIEGLRSHYNNLGYSDADLNRIILNSLCSGNCDLKLFKKEENADSQI